MRFHRVQTLRRLPHPGRGFTQGLVLDGDLVWESTGQYGESSLRRYRLGAEQLDWSAPLPRELFGEGICLAGDRLWQLTWQERVALSWPPPRSARPAPGRGHWVLGPVPSCRHHRAVHHRALQPGGLGDLQRRPLGRDQ